MAKENEQASQNKKAKKYRRKKFTEEEKKSVLRIISDLEKQLDAAFNIRDAQEEEIGKLKQSWARAEEKSASLAVKLEETSLQLVSQGELKSELKFLQNEKLEDGKKIKGLEEGRKGHIARIEALENDVAELTNETKVRNDRIQQIQLDLDNASSEIQELQTKLSALEEVKCKLEAENYKLSKGLEEAIQEREDSKLELEKAKDSIDEIRLMLNETRTKSRERLYKTKEKETLE
jgi:chromosome segregation ATPase